MCGGSGVEQVYRCPASQVDDSGLRAISAWVDWQKGILPTRGARDEQDATFGDAMRVISSEKVKIDEANAPKPGK